MSDLTQGVIAAHGGFDRWQAFSRDAEGGAITDEPPPKVAAAGHHRCIINIEADNLDRWLTPEGRSAEELSSQSAACSSMRRQRDLASREAKQVLQLQRNLVKRRVPVAVLLCAGWLGTAAAQTAVEAPKGYSRWNVQGLYGSQYREPFNPNDVAKGIVTFENSSGWSWGSSYFFVDILRSDGRDQHATAVYSEWYPSASLSKLFGTKLSIGPLREVSATLGFNAGTKSTGAEPLVFLPGVKFDLNVPGFKFFSLGTYAYIDQGRLSGASNGCHATTYQVTPSWSLPFKIGAAKLSFDGFADFIGSHGECASQIQSQPQLKLDIGSFWGSPDKISVGIEWQYWDNKFGVDGLNESLPQLMMHWVF